MNLFLPTLPGFITTLWVIKVCTAIRVIALPVLDTTTILMEAPMVIAPTRACMGWDMEVLTQACTVWVEWDTVWA